MLSAMVSGAVGLDTSVPVGRQVDDLASRLAAGVKASLLVLGPASSGPPPPTTEAPAASASSAPVAAADDVKVEALDVQKGGCGCCVMQ